MLPKTSLTQTLGAIILLLYAAIFVLGFYVPLQIDEIGWAYVNQRAIADNHQLMILYPQCQAPATFAKTLPWIWYPFAWVNNFLFMQFDSPFVIKAIGMLRFVLILITVWFIIKPIASNLKISPQNVFVVFLALLGLDEIPLLLQVARPEQTILLSSGIFIALALNANYLAQRGTTKFVAAVLFVVTVLLLFPSHPKTITTLPLLLVCAWQLFHRLTASKRMAIAACVLFAGFAGASIAIWLDRHACPNSAFGQQVLAANTPPFKYFLKDPATFLALSLEAFFLGLLYDYNLHLHLLTDLDWLPEATFAIPAWLHNLNLGMMALVGCIRLFALCICFLVAGNFILHARKRADIIGAKIISCALLATMLALVLVSGVIRMWYFPALQEPLLIISALLLVPAGTKLGRKPVAIAGYVLLIISILNLGSLLYRYSAFINTPESRIKAYDFRPVFMESPLNYEEKETLINRAYAVCKLPPIGKAKHLFLDRSTYPALKHSFEPFDFDFSSEWNLYSNQKLFKLSKDYNSSGIIISCYHIPDELRPYLIEQDGYCCANAERLHTLTEGLR